MLSIILFQQRMNVNANILKNKRIVFVLSNLAFQALVGQIVVYSICKAPLGETFGYDEAFLGTMEAVTIIGEIVGSISILFIPLNAVNGYFLFAFLNSFAGLFLFFPRYITIPELRNFIVILVLFVQSFCLSALAYSQVIFHQYYDENSEKYEHSIWFSLTAIGDIVAIILAQYAIYNFGIRWEWVKMGWALYIFLIGTIMYFYLDDHSEGKMEIQEILSIENDSPDHQQEEIEDEDESKSKRLTKTQECLMFLRHAWKLLKEPNIFLVVVSFGVMEGLFSNILFWAPYYYIQINEQAYSMASILGFCVCLCVGGIVLEFFFFQILGLEKYSKNIAYTLLILSGISYFLLWNHRKQDAKLQIILLCVSNLFIASPYNRISTLDPVEEVEGEPHKVKTVFLLAYTATNIFGAGSTMIIGFLMKEEASYYWHVIMGNIVLIIFVQTIRKVFMRGPAYQEGNSQEVKQIKQIK